jgi:hypothetical protein
VRDVFVGKKRCERIGVGVTDWETRPIGTRSGDTGRAKTVETSSLTVNFARFVECSVSNGIGMPVNGLFEEAVGFPTERNLLSSRLDGDLFKEEIKTGLSSPAFEDERFRLADAVGLSNSAFEGDLFNDRPFEGSSCEVFARHNDG